MPNFQLALVAVLLALADNALAEQHLIEQWRDLWTRCRIAIEDAKPLNVDGLSPVTTLPETYEKTVRRYDNWRIMRRRQDRFAILEAEYRKHNGVRRICDVTIAPDAKPLNHDEEAVLARAFLIERAKLIANRTHETRNPDPIFPIIPLGVGPTKKNQNGCSVISFFMFDLSTNFFNSGTGEQVFNQGCAGSSFLKD
jgi:hypothetical protein